MLINMNDVYMSLQKGVIDGMASSSGLQEIFNLYEVVKYWSHISISVSNQNIVINQRKFDSLPKDIQDAIMSESGHEASRYITSTYRDYPDNKPLRAEMAAFIAQGGHALEEYTVPDEEAARWIDVAGKPIWDSWVAKMEAQGLPGQATLEKCLKFLEEEPA